MLNIIYKKQTSYTYLLSYINNCSWIIFKFEKIAHPYFITYF